MRIQFGGNLIDRTPRTFLFTDYTETLYFNKVSHVVDGYTNFDVICIGGGGGKGGTLGASGGGSDTKVHGGQGGGGGLHWVKGLLEHLPDASAIEVGAAGADGTDGIYVGDATDGENGGTSQFNEGFYTCYASGGAGGKGAQSNTIDANSYADGGQGGKGENFDPNGAAGGIAPIVEDVPGPPGQIILAVDGKDGTLKVSSDPFSTALVGEGGGGGAGGIAQYASGDIPSVMIAAASRGGRGSYDPANTLVYGPLGFPLADPPDFPDFPIISGLASGARVTPLLNTPFVYGRSGQPGIVIVRITAAEYGLY